MPFGTTTDRQGPPAPRGVTVLLATIKVFAVISAVALSVIAMAFYAFDGSESDQW
jgi:hypothetical protein